MRIIHKALNKLELTESRTAEVVMVRYIVGSSDDETATAHGNISGMLHNEQRVRKAWPHRVLAGRDTTAAQRPER